MIDAKLLATYDLDGGGGPLDVYSVWMPRKADNVRFTVEVVANYRTELAATLWERNYDETGDGATAGVAVGFNQTMGRETLEKLGCKDLVRFQFRLNRGEDLLDTEIGWVLLRVLQPVWFESVKV